jgi:hypothetical protein
MQRVTVTDVGGSTLALAVVVLPSPQVISLHFGRSACIPNVLSASATATSPSHVPSDSIAACANMQLWCLHKSNAQQTSDTLVQLELYAYLLRVPMLCCVYKMLREISGVI